MSEKDTEDMISDVTDTDDFAKKQRQEAKKRDCLFKLLIFPFDGTAESLKNYFEICEGLGVLPCESLCEAGLTPLAILNDHNIKHIAAKVVQTINERDVSTEIKRCLKDEFRHDVDKLTASKSIETIEQFLEAYQAHDLPVTGFISPGGKKLTDIAQECGLDELFTKLSSQQRKEIESKATERSRADAEMARAFSQKGQGSR